jgi:hypothetical protein
MEDSSSSNYTFLSPEWLMLSHRISTECSKDRKNFSWFVLFLIEWQIQSIGKPFLKCGSIDKFLNDEKKIWFDEEIRIKYIVFCYAETDRLKD